MGNGLRRACPWLLAAVLAASAAAACGGGGGVRRASVTLREWSVQPSPAETRAGRVRFEVENAGTRPHEMLVVKSDLPPDLLPVSEGRVAESMVNVAGEAEAFGAGEKRVLELDLSPGKYLLLCNLVELPPGAPAVSHYQNGMVAAFLVTP